MLRLNRSAAVKRSSASSRGRSSLGPPHARAQQPLRHNAHLIISEQVTRTSHLAGDNRYHFGDCRKCPRHQGFETFLHRLLGSSFWSLDLGSIAGHAIGTDTVSSARQRRGCFAGRRQSVAGVVCSDRRPRALGDNECNPWQSSKPEEASDLQRTFLYM
jgi:hypothetical protein